MPDIVVPEEIIREIAAAEEDYWRRVRKCDPLAGARFLASGYREKLERLREIVGEERLASSRILEIGSGNGFLLCCALKEGLDIVGVEPGEGFGFQGRSRTAEELLRLNGLHPDEALFNARAESLPFEDESFDVVFSVAVLEHVENVDLAVRESLRVLRPGGIFWANVPNYHSWHESHYDIFWIPFLRKGGARLYVKRFFGRDPSFVDELNFTTPADFRPYLDSPVSRGSVRLQGKGLAAYVFAARHLCLQGAGAAAPSDGRGKRLLAALCTGRISTIMKRLLAAAAGFLQFAGMAPDFDVFLHKGKQR